MISLFSICRILQIVYPYAARHPYAAFLVLVANCAYVDPMEVGSFWDIVRIITWPSLVPEALCWASFPPLILSFSY
jgi:hypothetical protein